MGRPLGPGGRFEFLKVLRYWKKNSKNTGGIRHNSRTIGDQIVTM